MPKNKGKYAKERAAAHVVEPEEQIRSFGQKIYETLKPHAAKIGALVGALAVVLVGFSIWSYATTKREQKQTRAFHLAMVEAQSKVGDKPAVNIDPDNPDSIDLSDLTATPKYKTYKDRDEATLSALKDVDDSKSPGDQAALVKGSLLFDLGRYDDAVKEYAKYPSGGPLAFLAKEGTGYAKEAKALAQTDAAAKNAGLDEALKAFQSIQTDEKGAHYDLAAYHQARILAEKGDSANAIALYKKALDKNPSIELQSKIRARLALLGDTSTPAQ